MEARQHVLIDVPLDRARELVPDEVAVGRTGLRIGGEPRWSLGPTWGPARVELEAHGDDRTRLTVALGPARWPWRPFLGPIRRRREASRLAQLLRYEIETRAAQRTDRVSVRRVPSLRVLSPA